jgi:hypothetical protein
MRHHCGNPTDGVKRDLLFSLTPSHVARGKNHPNTHEGSLVKRHDDNSAINTSVEGGVVGVGGGGELAEGVVAPA